MTPKERLEFELAEAEGEVLLSSKLQYKKEMAEMFEKLTSPKYQEERRLKETRRKFIKSKTILVGLL